MSILFFILLSYLIGSIPFAFILVKLIKKIDLRTVGSGNVGATNAMRVIGFRLGTIALLLDAAKGIIPVVFFAHYVKTSSYFSIDATRLLFGIASICGHNWTLFLNFKGGKGIATSFGVLIGLAISNIVFAKVLLLLMALWTLIFVFTGYVSLASIIASIFLPIFLLFYRFNPPFLFFGIIISIFALYRHKPNINRLLQHKEHRFNVTSKILALFKKALS